MICVSLQVCLSNISEYSKLFFCTTVKIDYYPLKHEYRSRVVDGMVFLTLKFVSRAVSI